MSVFGGEFFITFIKLPQIYHPLLIYVSEIENYHIYTYLSIMIFLNEV